MKKKLLFLLAVVLFGTMTISAQAPSDYRPFLKEGKVWNCQITERTTERIGEATASYLQTTVFGLRIDGDIVFDGKTYKRFFRDTISVERKLIDADPESAAESLPQYEYREGGGTALNEEFLREEGRKIFIYWPPRGTELLLYDFSLAEGESTSGNYAGGSGLSVDKIETIVAQGQEFRRFVLSSPDRKNLFWIEGVGHPCGPFRAYGNEVSDGREYTLLSVYEDGECVFSKDDFNAQAIGTNEIETIQKDCSDFKDNAIYDLQGRRLKTAPKKGVYIRGGKKFVRK